MEKLIRGWREQVSVVEEFENYQCGHKFAFFYYMATILLNDDAVAKQMGTTSTSIDWDWVEETEEGYKHFNKLNHCK